MEKDIQNEPILGVGLADKTLIVLKIWNTAMWSLGEKILSKCFMQIVRM